MPRGNDCGLDVGQKTGQSCSQEVWQQAERAMTLRAVPARNSQPERLGPCIAAVPNQRADAWGMQWAVSEACLTPLLAGNVGVDG